MRRVFTRVKAAYNVLAGRAVQLDKNGWPVFDWPTESGENVTAETAMQVAAVHACVHLLSSVIAAMPLVVYYDGEKGDRTRAKDSELYWMLSERPNTLQTAYEYWQYNLECILLRGGFISWKNEVNGRIQELIALHPDTVTREIDNATGKMLISGIAEWGPSNHFRFDRVPQDQFFWANYRTIDGLNPISPIRSVKEAVGLAISAEKHGARTFKNDATPPLVVSVAEKLSPEHLQNLAMMWKMGGSGNNYGMPRFLDGGAKLDRLQMSNEDAQYLETRRFQREEIAGIFGVPPSMIGDTAKAQGWSTLEQKGSDLLTYTLTPYLTNIEQAVKRSLIPRRDRDKISVDYDEHQLMRANTKDRISYYKGLFDMGAISPNEIRTAEDFNRRTDGGDEYYITANTQQKEVDDEQPQTA